MKRHRMSKSYSRQSFTRGAVRTHRYNVASTVMRGGIRL